ncbi:ArsA family ATPase [Egibacter rhizosphaerae]|nr:TRC40/GET3/ArsA family transport-energizing ATPase [Egibacter rhizosphaerae]
MEPLPAGHISPVRVLLVTGKGGVGKTSVAAATARRLARDGARTLVLSTDPAHSLADALDHGIGPEPTEVAPGLHAEQLDAQQRLAAQWTEIRGYLSTLLTAGGLDSLEAEELTVVPGLEELFALLDVQRHAEDGHYDAVVVDCAPTAETLRLLALPDALANYIDRGLAGGGRVARAVFERTGGVPLPGDDVLRAADRLQRRLRDVRARLLDTRHATVRLVTNAERVVVAETRRTHTALHLFGYHVDAVVVNRLLPEAVTDPWLEGWKRRQAETLDEIHDGFAGVPVLTAPLLEEEAVGGTALDRLGDALYADLDPAGVLADGEPLSFSSLGGGVTRMRLALPFAAAEDVTVHTSDAELFVTVGGRTGRVAMPPSLIDRPVTAARVRDEALEVDFAAAEPAAAS